MSKRIIYTCDRCGQDIVGPADTREGHELCHDCAASYQNLTNHIAALTTNFWAGVNVDD